MRVISTGHGGQLRLSKVLPINGAEGAIFLFVRLVRRSAIRCRQAASPTRSPLARELEREHLPFELNPEVMRPAAA